MNRSDRKRGAQKNRDYLDYAYEQLASAMRHVHYERKGYPSDLESVEARAKQAVMAIRKCCEQKHGK